MVCVSVLSCSVMGMKSVMMEQMRLIAVRTFPTVVCAQHACINYFISRENITSELEKQLIFEQLLAL